MKASEAGLLDFLRKAPQFVIPIYQRPYSWTEQECRQLWNDIVRAGAQDAVTGHFIGSIVYIEKGLSQVVNQSPLLVIDGQQRITTVMLILAALVHTLEQRAGADREPIEGFSPLKLRHYYLTNPVESGDRRYKLVLSQTDRESLLAIVSGHDLPLQPSLRITANYDLFATLINDGRDDIETICKGLSKLIVVDIALNRDQDNPQLIFESMNSTGRELSQADLIRNFILMDLEPETQSDLYERYWRPMEIEFGQQAYSTHFDAFIRHYLTFRTGDIPNVRDVYEAFKS